MKDGYLSRLATGPPGAIPGGSRLWKEIASFWTFGVAGSSGFLLDWVSFLIRTKSTVPPEGRRSRLRLPGFTKTTSNISCPLGLEPATFSDPPHCHDRK